jgi:hypothetical protein
MTAEAFDAASGMCTSIAFWLTGKAEPTSALVGNMARLLGCDPAELTDPDGPPPSRPRTSGTWRSSAPARRWNRCGKPRCGASSGGRWHAMDGEWRERRPLPGCGAPHTPPVPSVEDMLSARMKAALTGECPMCGALAEPESAGEHGVIFWLLVHEAGCPAVPA